MAYKYYMTLKDIHAVATYLSVIPCCAWLKNILADITRPANIIAAKTPHIEVIHRRTEDS